MTARTAAARAPRGPLPSRSRGRRGRRAVTTEAGWLSLEAVMILPILALLAAGLLEVAAVVRDVLIVHDAARAGARAAATSTGEPPVRAAVDEAAPGLETAVTVTPVQRSDGDVVTVTVTTERTLGPVRHRLGAEAVARVEPAVGTVPLWAPPQAVSP